MILSGLVCAGVAFVAGRWSVSQGEDLAGRKSRIAPVRFGRAWEIAKTGTVRNAGQQPTPEFLAPALKPRNRLTRLEHVLEWAKTIDGTNWREALDTWLRSGVSSSYSRDLEARLVLERIGAMGGGEAMTAVRAAGGYSQALAFRCRSTAAGWASTHPAEAMEWFEAQDGKLSHVVFHETQGGMMEGLSQSDLALAHKLSGQVPSYERVEHLRGIMDTLERDGGGEEAIPAWIMRSREENREPYYTSELIGIHLERELSRAAGDGEKTAALRQWAIAQCIQPGASPALAGSIVEGMARQSTTQALDWLATLPAALLESSDFKAIATRGVSNPEIFNMEEIEAWAKAHPGHAVNNIVRRLADEGDGR